MTDQRQLDRMLGAFFDEGVDELADRVIDAALDEIGRTRQRRAARLPFGFPPMNLFTRLATAAVIGLVAVGGTLYLAGLGQPSIVGPGTTPIPSPSPSPSTSPSASSSPSPIVMPGEAVYVFGTETLSVTSPGTQSQVGDVTRLRGRINATVDTMNDPSVTGTGTITTDFDLYGSVGPQWGTYRLANAEGAWEGTWTGALWEGGSATNLSGWLVGSGAYEGWTYYVHVWGTGSLQVNGVVFPGSPPATAALPTWSPSPASSRPTVEAGPAYVTGTMTYSRTGGTETLVGDVRQYRDSGMTAYSTMSDPRVSGQQPGRLDYDLYGDAGPEWGTFHLEKAGGAWAGTHSGALWDQDRAANRSDLAFWSVGSGAYEGWTYYEHLQGTGASGVAEGIIFPGPPPTP
jgi:hypothetical protein